MTVKQHRILIFGAGVIGSIYAIKFMEAGFDVTMLARSDRFHALKENGLKYNIKGEIKTINVKVIDKLENDDRYDFIFVTVRYDRSESALLALKDNQSKIIVTMISNSIGFSSWLDIVGDRLLPAAPGVGGQIKDGILYPRFLPKLLAATNIGEINGSVTVRIKMLAELLKAAKLPYAVNNDMRAFLITHAVTDIAMLGFLNRDLDKVNHDTINIRKTARQITITIKKNVGVIQQAGVTINPTNLKLLLNCPNWVLSFFFRLWLRTNMVKDMMLPDYAFHANNEMVQLNNDLKTFVSQKGFTLYEGQQDGIYH
ncbi:ketopantoate reductase family protein [Paenibacillus daejeonensis]|uniref:ketopantoate reductase family protein n=1 Tax=Paenibacillus daejeonensis TaxID=135193 RepID=UPI00035CAF7D|nr:2-dehydropantoate 2-reductase N-terminal domain-containing protein [Paenibacillus daejeonensis]